MNLGKFQKKYLHAVDAQGINCDCMDCTAVTCRDAAALKIIEELERALDAKNIQIAAKKPVVKLSQKYLDQIKRYKDYGIE